MIIRAGVVDDLDACIGIWLDALRARDGRAQGPDVAARARAKFDRAIVRFAVVGDQPSAFALTVEADADPGGPVAMLELLAVAPGSAARGMGRALVEDAVRESTRLGHSAVELRVRKGNARAENLYISCGFTPHGEPAPHPLGGPPMLGYALRL